MTNSNRSSEARQRPRVLLVLVAFVVALSGFVVGLGGAPADASTSPGTLVFIKEHNVWIANGDGSGARQVTTGGTASTPWISPSESDSGIIVAARGNLIHRMDQFGTILSTIDPPTVMSSANEPLGPRPTKVAISPDGGKIAYTYAKYSCPPGAACRTRWTTAFTAANRLTSPDVSGLTFYDNPYWVTNDRVLVNSWLTQHIRLFDLGRGDIYWFDENVYTSDDRNLADMELSRDGRYGAAVRDDDEHSRIIWYSVTGNVRDGGRPPFPTPLCQTNEASGFKSPTLAPDGSALAWEEPDGIWVKHDLDDCSGGLALLIRGGSHPSWSPATLRTSRPSYHFSLVAKPKISGTARTGRTLTVSTGTWTPVPASYSYRWYRDGKPIAKAAKRMYKITSKDRKHTITAKVTARRSGVPAKTATAASVRIR